MTELTEVDKGKIYLPLQIKTLYSQAKDIKGILLNKSLFFSFWQTMNLT